MAPYAPSESSEEGQLVPLRVWTRTDWILRQILAIDDLSEDTRNDPRLRGHYDSSDSSLSIALLLKMLSDPSEKVLRYDLQLLAQISSNSEDEYFPSFMMNLLSLFSTDRKLLETRGSLIIRQLCVSLNTERIYRTFAEILEKDEVGLSFTVTGRCVLMHDTGPRIRFDHGAKSQLDHDYLA